MLDDKLSRAIRPDAQAFDEIRITTVPRFKESELSGDEWRISALVQFFRKGELKDEKTYVDTKTAAIFLGVDYINSEHAYYGAQGPTCDQEGCAEEATVKLEIVESGCEFCGQGKELYGMRQYRQFCERHKNRGDSSLDDSSQCYKKLED